VTTTDLQIRPAADGDLEQLIAIYNHYVTNTHITFDTEAFSVAERQKWFQQFSTIGPYRLLVGVMGDKVVGYASSTVFKAKSAYRSSVETSVYLNSTSVGQGFGPALYGALLDALVAEPSTHRAYGGVALPNEPSVELHQRMGFKQVASFHEVGFKFDKYWDVSWFEKNLE